jgi:hypothetical protein
MSRTADDAKVVEEMFLTFLSRQPSEYERGAALAFLEGKTGAARNTAIEDVAWSLVNKTDFMFSY